MICKYFLPFCGLPFYSIVVSFEAQNFEIFTKSSVSNFSCYLCLWRDIRETTAKCNIMSLCPMFSHSNFVVLALTFRSLIHFELIFI